MRVYEFAELRLGLRELNFLPKVARLGLLLNGFIKLLPAFGHDFLVQPLRGNKESSGKLDNKSTCPGIRYGQCPWPAFMRDFQSQLLTIFYLNSAMIFDYAWGNMSCIVYLRAIHEHFRGCRHRFLDDALCGGFRLGRTV